MTRTPKLPRMRLNFSFRHAIPALVAVMVCGSAQIARAQAIEDSIPPGTNFDKAQFRLWYPKDGGKLRAVLVLVPGSNGDGRAMADDSTWQAFASRNKLAIVACRFTDKPHEQGFIENYVNVSQGSGQALLDALTHLAARVQHPEIASAPLLFWGMSAGGEFNYEFAAWKPERVIAFVVNKGGIYYSALTSRATRQVPALLFIGGKDLDSRVSTITGLFAVNRRGGALWALAEEPGAGHIVGRSRDMSIIFFDDVLPLRLDESSGALKPMVETTGYIGELKTKRTEAVADTTPTPYLTAWLPTARVARAWQAMATEKPFE
jgi:poly(3-hydroxybutyrate) depolymerase